MALNAFAGGHASMAGLASKTKGPPTSDNRIPPPPTTPPLLPSRHRSRRSYDRAAELNASNTSTPEQDSSRLSSSTIARLRQRASNLSSSARKEQASVASWKQQENPNYYQEKGQKLYENERMEKNQTKTKKNKKMIFMAGSPGSGKSTLLKKLGLFDAFVIVNPDDWYVKSLKKRGLTLDMRNIDVKDRTRWDIFIRALNSAKDMAEELSRKEKEFIIDGTSGNYKYIHKLATKYKKMGYSIAMIYVSTSLEESISRNNKRGDNGGRSLQETIIEKSWKSVQKHCRKYDELFGNNFFFIDNTTDVDLDSKGNTGKSIREKIQTFID